MAFDLHEGLHKWQAFYPFLRFLSTILVVAVLYTGCLDHKRKATISNSAQKKISARTPAKLSHSHIVATPQNPITLGQSAPTPPQNLVIIQSNMAVEAGHTSTHPYTHKSNPTQANHYWQLAQEAYTHKDYQRAKTYYLFAP